MKAEYSKREISLLRILLSSRKKEVSLDYLCRRYEKETELKMPKNIRSSIASTMRHLEWKSHARGEPAVMKVTGRGRGEKAKYMVLTDAKKIVRELGPVVEG